jgi:hypothetical protein
MNNLNNLTKFTSNAATSYADMVEKNKLDEASRRAEGLIKYIEKKYEKAVKKAILQSNKVKKVSIVLPYLKKIEDNTIFDEVDNVVKKHFDELGFNVHLSKPNYCSCPFDYFCNGREFKAIIRWL